MCSIVASVRVDIWSDVICPWCYIGKHRFDTAVTNLRARGITDAIDVTFHSYQLDPTAPMGQTAPVIEAYAKKFGGSDNAERIINHVTSVAAADGIEFRMDIAQRANTMHAHRALHYALTHHGMNAQALLKQQLLQAYFTDGENISDLSVIAKRAAHAGIHSEDLRTWLESDDGYDAVADDIRGASARDITAVPSFVINDQFLIPGAQDVQVFENILERVLSRTS
jgi:predicted DsbA family dithiol-disulfide isomerase